MKKLFPFLLALAVATAAQAFSFSQTVQSGQTLYFTITSASAVKVVAPATVSWNGYGAPTGNLVIPATVTHEGTTYSVTAIDRMAFQQCYGLTEVHIPGSVVSVGQRAFAEDSMLVTAVLDEGVQRIDMMAFIACTALDTIELPNSLMRIAVSAFENTAYYNNMDNWSSEMMLTLGQWVLKVGNIATGTVHVHEGVRGIANNAFLYCHNIDRVVLPTTMRVIGDGAFKECFSLDTVQMQSPLPPAVSDDSFADVDPLPVLLVPCSTATNYTSAQYWSDFTVVESPCPVAIEEVEPTAEVEVSAVQGGVVVHGLEGDALTVCDMLGRRVCSVQCAGDAQYLPLPVAGLYVLLPSRGGAVKMCYSFR